MTASRSFALTSPDLVRKGEQRGAAAPRDAISKSHPDRAWRAEGTSRSLSLLIRHVLLDELRELQRVGGPVVARAVVHQGVHVLRGPRRLRDARRPVRELVLVVEVAEPLVWRDVRLL